MNKAKFNDWVEIEEVLLEAGERAPQLSEDTQNTPLRQWIKGYLLKEEANIGEKVEIKTMSGRIAHGKLSEINPKYVHEFGVPIKELIDVGKELRNEIKSL